MTRAQEPVRYDAKLVIKCPEHFAAAVQTAARQECMTPSAYMRRAIIDALRSGGIKIDGRV